mgnify:CR=1 FL=1
MNVLMARVGRTYRSFRRTREKVIDQREYKEQDRRDCKTGMEYTG